LIFTVHEGNWVPKIQISSGSVALAVGGGLSLSVASLEHLEIGVSTDVMHKIKNKLQK
jgi:hypothetical protein